MAELRQRIKPTASIQDGPKEKPIDDPKETEEDPKKGRPVPTGYTSIAIILTLLAMFTRLYKLSDSPKVVWDEAHFGKFAGYYIKRTFYFDVHPPLGKMINGFAGLVAGFNGTFEFKSGEPYPKELNFGIMRFFNALFGIGLTPLAYYTGVHLRLSVFASTLLGILTIEEIATMTISRFILLDSMLLFFTALSVYSLALFRNHQLNMPFSFDWFTSIGLVGLSIGMTASVKWVGLFVIALVGIHTIEELWDLLGNLRISIVNVYTGTFYMHFSILNRSGPGDAQMSSLFQAGLQGIDFSSNPIGMRNFNIELAYGSEITIKNSGRGGSLLHSHVQKFPSGSGMQQVTCYSHKDDNNIWIVEKGAGASDPQAVEFVNDGDVIRLVHKSTKAYLRSHDFDAPITIEDQEVSCSDNSTASDAHVLWKVERVTDISGAKSSRIRSLSTKFKLRHVNSGCLLRARKVTLPEWGFKQTETTCQRNPNEKCPMPAGGKNAFRSTFWADFIDLNIAMWSSNNALTPDPDKEADGLTSQPYHWPLLLKGLRMASWGDDDIKYYLLGTPVIYWGSLASVIVLFAMLVVYVIRRERGNVDFLVADQWEDFYFSVKVGVFGWALHYFPFYIMGRVMYVHHYFPALYFGMISFAVLADQCTRKSSTVIKTLIFGVIVMITTANFLYFVDFALGFKGPAKSYSSRRWIKSWNLHD